MLRFLADVAADPQAAAALDNPKLTAADKAALLLSIGGERLDATGRNFVRVLVDADRVAVLPQIRMLFEALKNDADGVAKARIDSAFPLSDAQTAELKAALEKRFGREDRGDRQRRPGARRRRADHRRRHGDRRHHRGAACGDGHPVTGLISKLPRAGGGSAGATRGHHAVESF